MAGMTTAQAVLRGFRVSWQEWTRRPGPEAAVPAEPVARFRCWTVAWVPPGPAGEPPRGPGRR